MMVREARQDLAPRISGHIVPVMARTCRSTVLIRTDTNYSTSIASVGALRPVALNSPDKYQPTRKMAQLALSQQLITVAWWSCDSLTSVVTLCGVPWKSTKI
ncbi:hypothetical protein ElyMa_002028400 [Elysia marginata]|uniref:Uncharacterized protein n=1 Tax=Elysia marginata TaxID=1093978 RepID=A0AAV4F625_9GAST|nr:hypothetical protein ElyMa_002028400 [Elysia marginata]